MCEVLAKKILNCRIVGARQSFQIFRQNTWFLENNRALSKIFYGILNYLISIIKLKKIVYKKTILFQPRKPPEKVFLIMALPEAEKHCGR